MSVVTPLLPILGLPVETKALGEETIDLGGSALTFRINIAHSPLSFKQFVSFCSTPWLNYFAKTFVVLLRFYTQIDGVRLQINIRCQDRIELLKQTIAYLRQVTHTSVVS